MQFPWTNMFKSHAVTAEREAEYEKWIVECDSVTSMANGWIATVTLLFWIAVICPYMSPQTAFSTPVNIIHACLLVVHLFWCTGALIPFVMRHRESFLTLGNLSASVLYVLIIHYLDQKWLTHAPAFFNLAFIAQIFVISGCRMRYQIVFAFCSSACYAGATMNVARLISSDLEWTFIAGFWSYMIMFALLLGYSRVRSLRDAFNLNQELKAEKDKSQRLLANILPGEIIERFSTTNEMIAEQHENVTVLFTDIVGFTDLAKNLSAQQIVTTLNDVFSNFDDICSRLKVEKIKTIGDAYMAASSLPTRQDDHAEIMIKVALEMQASLAEYCARQGVNISMRVGIHTGPVVAGIIGKSKFCFDLWGDTVNLASRLESAAMTGRILVSSETMQCLPAEFSWEEPLSKDLKGFGPVSCGYLVERRAVNRSLRPTTRIA